MREQTAGEWIQHDGKGMPVPVDTIVQVQHGDGWISQHPVRASVLRWAASHAHGGKYDIVAYRIHKPEGDA